MIVIWTIFINITNTMYGNKCFKEKELFRKRNPEYSLKNQNMKEFLEK